MNYHLLAGPVIGAAIGYFTNYIEVKMMFRPLHPVKIGSRTLPFTPGIIPRGKSRLAKAIGEAVGENLLTEESFAETLLSPDIEKHLKEKIRLFLYENRKNEKTLKWRECTTGSKAGGKSMQGVDAGLTEAGKTHRFGIGFI